MGTAKDLVLVVDDEPQVLVALEDLLSEQFRVVSAGSAERALHIVEQEPELAVVMTDQRMPRMSGDELIARAADRSSATRILLTGYADLAAIVRAVNDGRLFAYVSKPWEREDLRLKVSRAAEHYHLAKELSEERQLLHDLMDNIPDGIYFKDLELRFRRANRAFGTLFGSGVSDVLGRSLGDLVDDGADAEATEKAERALIEQETSISDVTRKLRCRGAERWLSESKAAIRGVGGTVIGLVGVTRDVTQRRAEEERAVRIGKMRALMSSVNAAIVRLSEPSELVSEVCRVAVGVGELAAAAVMEVGVAGTHVLSRAAADGVSHQAVLDVIGAVWASVPGLENSTELRMVMDDLQAVGDFALRSTMLEQGLGAMVAFPLHRGASGGRSLLLFARDAFFFEDEVLKLVGETASSVSLALDHIDKRQQVEFLSFHDALTGLPNRRLLLDRISQQLILHERSAQQLALVLVDLGRFRQLNDALGRGGGDELLIQVARRLEALDGLGTVARFDGNVFALVLPALESETSVGSVVDNDLPGVFKEAFLIAGHEVSVATRAGVAMFPTDGDRAEVLLASAEAALKSAKASLQPYGFYAPTMNARVAEQLSLETRLRRAVAREEFDLHYQPKVDLKSGQIVGLEALIRWAEEGGAMVSPGQFIPVLEETGLIREVGRWVLERAARQYADWQTAGVRVPRIAVNVSGLQLGAPDFVARVEHVLSLYPHDAAGIDIEITESVFVDDLAGSVAKLATARDLGLRVAIDDFGTGYSSLSYLASLPIDALKIDRSFVLQMVENPQSTSIVTTIISLAHALELDVIAEGVETREQARFLRLLKCDEIQGYLISKPVAPQEIPGLLGRRYTPSTLPSG